MNRWIAVIGVLMLLDFAIIYRAIKVPPAQPQPIVVEREFRPKKPVMVTKYRVHYSCSRPKTTKPMSDVQFEDAKRHHDVLQKVLRDLGFTATIRKRVIPAPPYNPNDIFDDMIRRRRPETIYWIEYFLPAPKHIDVNSNSEAKLLQNDLFKLGIDTIIEVIEVPRL